MKRIYLILIVVITLSTIFLQGCVDQNNSGPKLVTTSLNKLGFKSNELPFYVDKQTETFNDTEISVDFPPDMNVVFLEVYRAEYTINESIDFLSIEMEKLNSTDVAKEYFNRKKSDLSDSNFDILNAETIGDESAVGRDRDVHIIIFRKYNVVSAMYPSISTDLPIQDFIDYSKIIVNHIESSV